MEHFLLLYDAALAAEFDKLQAFSSFALDSELFEEPT
jgi:hypothetical protein